MFFQIFKMLYDEKDNFRTLIVDFYGRIRRND